jgi:peptidoglycan hydrolase CwlO-like protein
VLAVVGLLAWVGPARAATAIDLKRAEVRQVEAQLYALDTRARSAVAAHEAAQRRLADIGGRLRRARADLARARGQYTAARALLARRVEGIYRRAQPDALELVVAAESVSAVMESQRMLSRIGRRDAETVSDLKSLRKSLVELRATLSRERVRARAASADTRARRDELVSAVGARRAVLVRAQRSLAALITQEQQRARAARLTALRRAQVALAARAAGGASSGVSAGPATFAVSSGAPASALDQIAQCESGGNPGAVSPGGQFRGKYQFHPDTWRNLGGQGADPVAASEAEQDRVAALLYSREGAAPWPVCGR